jgi:prevent-host-death family protein
MYTNNETHGKRELMNVSTVDLRYRTKDVLRAVERGESVIVLQRGKEKARIVAPAAKRSAAKLRTSEAFGLWKGRKDLQDVSAYVRKLRQPRDL